MLLEGRRLHVVVAAAVPATRTVLRRLVECRWGWRVAGEARDATEATKLCRLTAADVLLVDDSVEPIDAGALADASGTAVVSILGLPPHRPRASGMSFLAGTPPGHIRDAVELVLFGDRGAP